MDLQTKYRALTWNIMQGGTYAERIESIVSYISGLSPDIILLQEIDKNFEQPTIQLFQEAGYTLKIRTGNPSFKQESSIGIAYRPDTFMEVNNPTPLNVNFEAMALDLVPCETGAVRGEAAYVNPSHAQFEPPLRFASNILTVISYHGYWGGLAQPVRLRETAEIDRYVKSKNNAAILGGDFNARPNEPAVSYLRGDYIYEDKGTLWVEAQECAQRLSDAPIYNTSFAHGPIVEAKPGYDTAHMPERRIDYLFSYGFAYARPYAFDGTTRITELESARTLSDHAPILAGVLG